MGFFVSLDVSAQISCDQNICRASFEVINKMIAGMGQRTIAFESEEAIHQIFSFKLGGWGLGWACGCGCGWACNVFW